MHIAKQWHEILRETRLNYGLTQEKLAVEAGIARRTLSYIESGESKPSQKVKESLDLALIRLNPDNPIEIIMDYVRIRFPTTDYTYVIEHILRLKLVYMAHEEYGFYSYETHYKHGDIFVLTSTDEKKGTLLELKGRGCRQYEQILNTLGKSWFDFFYQCSNENAKFKRIDIAINDKYGILDIPELALKCKKEECISVFRSFKDYLSGELVRKSEKNGMGRTLYIGSLKSEVYFCIYEKDFEQYIKFDVPIEDAEIKNRFEIRLKNERAEIAVNDLLCYRDVEKTAFEIINRYVRFVDEEEVKDRNNWDLNKRWEDFIGAGRGTLKLTMKPEPASIEKTLNWINKQVASTLKMALTIDEIRGTTIIADIVNNAKLGDKHEKIIIQQTLPILDIIYDSE